MPQCTEPIQIIIIGEDITLTAVTATTIIRNLTIIGIREELGIATHFTITEDTITLDTTGGPIHQLVVLLGTRIVTITEGIGIHTPIDVTHTGDILTAEATGAHEY